ncbi:hypothetical protein AYO20_01185 [Fonsecaea nubica]|uniref:EXPERA domain-containing protein n=1 Tax=Fonsecaea nubica TaxID=856822 RepID=A0A178DE14_9EURO|nr:hypothetical protein AYO20_01185 [Fonsecaea nubica]OAL39315.1 hypothetical protein AYO20_01185 [Fonsecaea nubica]
MATTTPTTVTRRATPRPLSTRKLDMVYLAFFIVHVPIMFWMFISTLLCLSHDNDNNDNDDNDNDDNDNDDNDNDDNDAQPCAMQKIFLPYSLVDLASILPSFLVSPLSHTLRAYQLERFQDQFFVSPPAWFTAYMWIEAVYHVPISLWMVWGLFNDHPLVPLHLLIFSLEVAVTTLTCIVDISSWKGYSSAQKSDLYGLYVPYLVLGTCSPQLYLYFVFRGLFIPLFRFHVTILAELVTGSVFRLTTWSSCISACLMGVDAFVRVKRQILQSGGLEKAKTL